MQRHGKAGIHKSNHIFRGGIHSIRARCSCCAYNSRECYFATEVLSRARARALYVTSTSLSPPWIRSVRRQDK
jgi:hypothetical protein